jgi:hypothetical protein
LSHGTISWATHCKAGAGNTSGSGCVDRLSLIVWSAIADREEGLGFRVWGETYEPSLMVGPDPGGRAVYVTGLPTQIG